MSQYLAQIPSRLFNSISDAIAESGWNIIYPIISDELPFILQIYGANESYFIRIYIFFLACDGGYSKTKFESEYRIQIEGIDHFETVPGEKTLILGWWDEVGVFAGFDVRKHLGKLGSSPSIQIREEFLRQAYVDGFSPCDKGNEEVAIAFRPDFFVEYVHSLEALHDFGKSSADLAVLDQVVRHPEINAADIQIPDTNRKIVVASVSKKLRDTNFRKRVLTAYGQRCAVCSSFEFVEAAHIVPVNHENSNDETSNGIALCALHHKAYDHALIAIRDDYSVFLNQSQVDDLISLALMDGFDGFTRGLRPIILLPPAVSDRPHAEYIKIANQIRGLE